CRAGPQRMERLIETLMLHARRLLAPVYLGLSLALLALIVKVFQEVWHLFTHILTSSEADVVLVVLSLIDLSLVGGLLIMVMMSGYENFVSQLDSADEQEKLSWLGKVDHATLKMKVAASIVAISSIHLLRQFMNMANVDPDMLKWYVIVHLTFA